MELKRIFGSKKMQFITVALVAVSLIVYLFQLYQGSYENKLFGNRDIQNGVKQEVILHVDSYHSYLNGIVNKDNELSEISIFQGADSNAGEDIERTKKAYEHLSKVDVSYGNYDAISSVARYEEIHYFILVFIFILVWNFFEDEKKGLKCIFYATPKGRAKLALHRIGVLFIGVSAFVFLTYLSIYIAGLSVCGGWEDLGNSIQSVPEFKECIFAESIVQYMLHSVGAHIVISFVLALFLWMMLLLFKDRIVSLIATILFFAVEFFLQKVITTQSVWAFLKYNNIFYFVFPDEMLRSYRNYQIFGLLINRECTFGIMVIVLGIISAIVCVSISDRRKTITEVGRLQKYIFSVGKKLSNFYHKWISKFNVFGMELYKILVSQKGIIIFIIWIAVLLLGMDARQNHYMGNSEYMNEVYQVYSGIDDGRLEEYVVKQAEFFDLLDSEYMSILEKYDAGNISEEEYTNMEYRMQSYEIKRIGLKSMQNQLNYIRTIKEEKEIDAWFMDVKGYRILWTGDGLYDGEGYAEQEKSALLAIVVLIVLLYTIFSYDRSCGMDKLILSTFGGRRKLFFTKMRVIMALCFLVTLITYGLKIYEVNAEAGLSCLEAPIQSLYFMKDYPLAISIMGYMLLLFGIHFLTLMSISMLICAVSFMVDVYKSLLISFVILVIPSAMDMMGISWCKKISAIQAVAYVEILQNEGFFYSLGMVLIWIFVGLLCYFFVKKRWCRE